MVRIVLAIVGLSCFVFGALADCPFRRQVSIDQEARYLLKDSPVVFTAEIVRTSLVGKLSQNTDPMFEDDYRVIEIIRGAVPEKTTLRIGTIGDGDSYGAWNSLQVRQFIRERQGRRLIVLTRNRDWQGKPGLIATGDCPRVSGLDTPHGKELIAAMKREVESEHH